MCATVFIVLPQTLCVLPFLVSYSYLYMWKSAPVSIPFLSFVAYCSALKKATAAVSTELVNFLKYACHHILERGILDHSTVICALKVTADRPHLLFTEFWHAVFTILQLHLLLMCWFIECKCVYVSSTQHQRQLSFSDDARM